MREHPSDALRADIEKRYADYLEPLSADEKEEAINEIASTEHFEEIFP